MLTHPIAEALLSTVGDLVPLAPTKVEEASVMLASSFHDDPFSRFMLPEERARPRWLRLIHHADLRQILPEGHVYTIGGHRMAGVIGLVPPGRYPLPTVRFLRYAASLAWRLPSGGLSLGRVVRALQAQRLVDRLHIREAHWYVSLLAVHPERQGAGLGRALLEPVLAIADRDRLPTYLETTKEINLGFYGRFGFEVAEEVDAPGGGPPIWTMLRAPVG